MRLPRSWILVLLISVGQLLSLIVGAFWFTSWMQKNTARILISQATENNKQYAEQISTFATTIGLTELEDSGNVDQLQSIVENTKLPNEGFVCLIDNVGGHFIAHPQLGKVKALERLALGQSRLNGGEASILEATQDSPFGTVSGWVSMPDGRHHIVAKQLPEHAILLVHQRQRSIDAAVRRLMNPIRGALFLVAAAISVLSTAISLSILERYDNRLARMNENLKMIVQKRTASLTKTRNAIIFGLAKLAESRDNDTGEHLERIRIYVTILAENLAQSLDDIDVEFISNLGLASSLHDIGKVGIPDAILLKPGRLTPDERIVIEEHPVIGGDCLRAIQRRLGSDDFLQMAREIAYHHHERWDGKGYPHRLRAEAIPLAARIVAIADVYDALTTKRPYKSPMTHEESRKIIVAGRGTQFDPQLVDAFLECEDEFRAISTKGTSATTTTTSIEEVIAVDSGSSDTWTSLAPAAAASS